MTALGTGRAPTGDLELGLAALALPHLAGASPEPVVMPTRNDVVIVKVGEVVVKAHAPGMDAAALRPRLAASARLGGIMLPPLDLAVADVAGRAATVWPAGEPVDPGDPDAAPWQDAARLLAALHAVPLDALPPLPPAGGPARVPRTVARIRHAPGAAAATVRAAAATLPALDALDDPAGGGPERGLTHGDWHMGQLVRHPPGAGAWVLIDVDDLGHGDQAWDLARPAAWFASGLLAPEVWQGFLSAYLGAGGRALGAPGADPWERLDLPARALTVQLAAAAVAAALREEREPDEVERILIDTCARIAGTQGRAR
ncbi:aminoglycoside phosphotransferase family protein [Thermocatellispora tengchongensis]